MNRLFYGDNLKILRQYIPDESVDLVYLDPPFKSNRDYNVLFAEQDGSRAAAQIKAFGDTWRWDQAASAAYQETVERGGDVSKAMQAFRSFLGETDMLAYLSMMAPRLIELRRVLKSSGSLYLHCDPTASHYLKMLLDAIFGPQCFLNEIIWHYRKWPTGKYTFQRNHDVILFYARSGDHSARTFNQLYMERAPSTLKRFGTARIVSGHDAHGRRTPSEMAEDDSEGVRMDDVWNIGRVPPVKQLFPTEKPPKLIKRLIEASSRRGDVVLDPFCGCGTTVVCAQELRRQWIGIDITHLAVTLIRHRLHDSYGTPIRFTYKVIGEPESLPDAHTLAESDPFQFQWWALGLVGARPTEQKKGADKGVDGRLYFHEVEGGPTQGMVLSVKSGHTGPAHVSELRGVMERERAVIGVLITLQEPTKAMRVEAAAAGFYDSPWGRHPRLQVLTIGELLSGKMIDYPPARQASVTYKRAEKIASKVAEQPGLYDVEPKMAKAAIAPKRRRRRRKSS